MAKSVKITEAQKLLENAASKYVSKEEAEYFAKEQLDTHMKKFPRVKSIQSAIEDLESWKRNPDNEFEVQVDKKASMLINFNKLGPSLKLKYIHDELENRAKEYGISMVGINNSGGIHTLNLWTDGLGKRDLIGICMFNGGPYGVVPFGGTTGIFGTNPISYAIPTADKPIIVDMATSEIPYFEIKDCKKQGKELKENAAVDQQGNPTTNPKKALAEDGTSNLLPMGGGYKGYALVFLIEILTGSLVRSLLSTEMNPDYVLEEHGGLIVAFDIASFTEIDKFKKSVTEMCDIVRKQKPCNKVKKILIPGDNSYERLEETLLEGEIEIDEEVLNKLQDLAK
ncbi:Ldh family oxidoreductase [Candidatus Dojkabacteria bacterium]|nr:Ldh family oxidoreductase [Candidatus Dojkabacteria bacterium]